MRPSGWLLLMLVVVAGACDSNGTGAGQTVTAPRVTTVPGTTVPTSPPTTVTVASSAAATTEPPTFVSTTTATTSPATAQTTAAAAASPEEAIAVFLNPGIRFLGDCTTADLTLIGAYCSSLWRDRGDTRIYTIGPVQSEVDSFLLLQRQSGGWAAEAGAPFNENGPPW